MRHICAWCKRETAAPDGTDDDHLITHGICEKCKLAFLAEITEMEKPEAKCQGPEIRN